MYTSKVSTRGQIVIPKKIRKDLNIHKNDEIAFIEKENVVILKKLDSDPYRAILGVLDKKASEQEIKELKKVWGR